MIFVSILQEYDNLKKELEQTKEQLKRYLWRISHRQTMSHLSNGSVFYNLYYFTYNRSVGRI